MRSASPLYQRPRGPWTELHFASLDGSVERLVALLLHGSINIDQGNPKDDTPLMLASYCGHAHVVRILLDNGANVSIVGAQGITALHGSAMYGHPAVSKMLMEAGADLEATMTPGDTPLHLAAGEGHVGVMDVLIKAGANLNSRKVGGSTPLYMAAQEGQLDAVKMLLREKANPLLATTYVQTGTTNFPIGMAAQKGHLEIVRELVRQVGIEGCGGASAGVEALRLAAIEQHLEIMAVLKDAGVVGDDRALATAIVHGRHLSVKSLLQQRKGDEATYVNHRNSFGETPLLNAMGFYGISSPSPRIVRLLIDAGADTASAVRVIINEDGVELSDTPLNLVYRMLREKKITMKIATEKQLHGLEGVRRLLLRVEAVHAVSWLWPVDMAPIVVTAEDASRKVATTTPLTMMLSILRRRTRRPRVLLDALFRWVVRYRMLWCCCIDRVVHIGKPVTGPEVAA